MSMPNSVEKSGKSRKSCWEGGVDIAMRSKKAEAVTEGWRKLQWPTGCDVGMDPCICTRSKNTQIAIPRGMAIRATNTKKQKRR